MRLCHSLPDMAFPIKLEQAANLSFRVTYGKQVKSGLTYGRAAAIAVSKVRADAMRAGATP